MAAIQFDTRLGELGGQRMLKRGVGDDRDEAMSAQCSTVGYFIGYLSSTCDVLVTY